MEQMGTKTTKDSLRHKDAFTQDFLVDGVNPFRNIFQIGAFPPFFGG